MLLIILKTKIKTKNEMSFHLSDSPKIKYNVDDDMWKQTSSSSLGGGLSSFQRTNLCPSKDKLTFTKIRDKDRLCPELQYLQIYLQIYSYTCIDIILGRGLLCYY